MELEQEADALFNNQRTTNFNKSFYYRAKLITVGRRRNNFNFFLTRDCHFTNSYIFFDQTLQKRISNSLEAKGLPAIQFLIVTSTNTLIVEHSSYSAKILYNF